METLPNQSNPRLPDRTTSRALDDEDVEIHPRSAMSTDRPELPSMSVVAPCHNEAASLPELHRRCMSALETRTSSLELILVDDGSTDPTSEVAAELARHDPRVRAIRLSRNFGKEAAMLAGLRAATGDVIGILDADLQHPPELLSIMTDRLLSDDVDQVVAKRDRQGESWSRTALSKFYYRLVNRLTEVPITDGEGDFRVMSRRAVDSLLSMSERIRFSKGLFSWIGYPRSTVTYQNVTRETGSSSWSFRSLLNYALDGVLAFSDKPLHAVLRSGAIVVALAVFYVIWLLVGWLTRGVSVPGYLTTVGVIVLLGGMQMVCIGIIGLYVGRIYTEVKRRPTYFVSETTGVGYPVGTMQSGSEATRCHCQTNHQTSSASPPHHEQPDDEGREDATHSEPTQP